ncbi:MAG: hypothetical protein J6B00_02360, partial [Alphaproteobacteria bacterium]|nr:hypothetical protein [Alphaproteobacteria bacterium]
MTDTKSAMKDDMKLAKAKTLLVRAGVDADKTLKQLVAKYGANTYDIVLNAMLKPTDMMIAAGQKFANTKKTIEYYASHQVSDVQLAKAINKTKAEIAKRSAQKGTSSTTNRQASTRASARSERFNNRVSNRAPSKTSAVNQNKHNANAKTKGIPFKSEEGLGYKAPWSANKTPTPAKSQTTKRTTQKTPAVKTTTSPKQTTNSTPGTVPYANNSGIVVEMPWHKNTQEEQTGQFAWQGAKVTTPEDVYNKSFEGRSDKVSLDELMKQTGVTQADIQAVFKAHPEIVQEMGGGKTNQALAKAASRVSGRSQHNCLTGVQEMHCAVNSENGEYIAKYNANWPEKIPQADGKNSACNVYIPLEKSGK